MCEEMLAALEALALERSFSIEVIDVDSDAELERRYGSLVPVLLHGDAELCHYHLDEGKVRAYLDKIR